MTSRELFLTAIRNEVPDRVPVAPDFSNYIPAKRTGLPFWEIYFHNAVPLWRAYLETCDYFGTEAWIGSAVYVPYLSEYADVEYSSTEKLDATMDAMVRSTCIKTPDGEMQTEEVCFRADPPSPTQKPIKNLETDWKKFKWLCRPPTGIDSQALNEVREECRKREQAFGVSICYPGFHMWYVHVQSGLEDLSCAMMDCPEVLDEWFELDLHAGIEGLKLLLAEKPDYILLGGSGTITMASPQLAMRYAVPALQEYSRLCKEAGVLTMLHSCGKSRVLVDMLAEHTEVNLINPLEIAPMGDVDLAEVKRSRGKQIALMGNLHTTDVMLRGTPELVREKAIEAMQQASEGGGFILSTGDQCGRETPDENIFAMVEAAHEFGVYDQATGTLPKLHAT
jgi:uroporphyrinogen-III decarboxylase